jgi:hypothetical protein
MDQSRHLSRGKRFFLNLLFVVFFCPGAAMAAPGNDEFIRGYATAILQRDFQVTAETLSVKSGIVYISGLEASDVVRDQVKTSISAIEGVSQVVIVLVGEAWCQRKEKRL